MDSATRTGADPSSTSVDRVGVVRAWLARWSADLLLVAAAVVYALPSLWYPPGNDVSIHWYIGRGLLQGELPYADGVDTRPPAPYYVHALSILLFGDRPSSVRVVDLLFALGCGALIATFRARRWANDRTLRPGDFGLAALLVCGIHYTFFDDYAVGHPELWQAFFMLGTLWAVARVPSGNPRPIDALVAGLFAGTAVMFKHTAALAGVFAAIALLILSLSARDVRNTLRILATFSSGVALTIGVQMLPFLWSGTLGAFYEVMVRFILAYGGLAPEGAGEKIPPWMTMEFGGLAVLFGLVAWVVGTRVVLRSRQRGGLVFAGWIALGVLMAFITVAVQQRGMVMEDFNYHFIVMGPFLALTIHWALGQRFGSRSQPKIALAIALLAVGFVWEPAWPFLRDWSYRKEWSSWLAFMRGTVTRDERLTHYGYRRNALDHYDRHERVAKWITAHARADETLCVRGCAAAIYQVSGLRCPSRFFSQDTVTYGLPEWTPEEERDMRELPPSYLVTFSDRRDDIQRFLDRGYVLHDDVEPARSGPRYVVLERMTGPEQQTIE